MKTTSILKGDAEESREGSSGPVEKDPQDWLDRWMR